MSWISTFAGMTGKYVIPISIDVFPFGVLTVGA